MSNNNLKSLANNLHKMASIVCLEEADILDRIRLRQGKDNVEEWNALLGAAMTLRIESDRRLKLIEPVLEQSKS